MAMLPPPTQLLSPLLRLYLQLPLQLHHSQTTSNLLLSPSHPSLPKSPTQKPFGCRRIYPTASHSLHSSISPDSTDEGFDVDLARLLALLPDLMRRRIIEHKELYQLIELVLDVGRHPLARFPSGDFVLSDSPVTFQEIGFAVSQVGDFCVDNRAGISRTLHRISAIRNRKGAIIGLTCRVGRVISGSANLLRDLVQHGASILVIGPPGVGKTTIIREIARMLANDCKKRVMIVDTSNEIGGDGDIPHAGIGKARRMQVPNSDMQHKVLIEAVENHMPQVIVIDEIGTKLEAMAARTIAQRGIQLVATAHGRKIENLIMNPSLETLVGGIQSVTLGDEEASRRGMQKTVLERKGPSAFSSGIEIVSKTELRVHHSLEATVDSILSGRRPYVEVRRVNSVGLGGMAATETHGACNDGEVIGAASSSIKKESTPFLVFLYGIHEGIVIQGVKQLRLEAMVQVTDDINRANAVLALQSKVKKNTKIQGAAESHDIPIYFTKVNSLFPIIKALKSLVHGHANGLKNFDSRDVLNSPEEMDALEEARIAIEQEVIPRGQSVELIPRPPDIISLQMDLVRKYSLRAEMIGSEMDSRVCILPLYINPTTGEPTDDGFDGIVATQGSTGGGSPYIFHKLPLFPG